MIPSRAKSSGCQTRKRYIARVALATCIACLLVPAENIMSYPVAKPVSSAAQAVECPACHHSVQMVAVAGHIQCPRCTTVVESCCEGPIPSFVQRNPPTTLRKALH